MTATVDTARLRELHAAATAGEWVANTVRDTRLNMDVVWVENSMASIVWCGAANRLDVHDNAAYIAAVHNALPDVLDALEQARAERDAALAELAQVRAQLATGKPQPTQRENDDAAARLAAMERMYERYGMDVKKWPQYALDTHTRLAAAQNEYEAKYC